MTLEVPMKPIVEMRGIRKEFPGVVANDNVTLTVMPGEIHAILGENGAGKSTLMSVLFGLYQAEAGEIFIKGEKVLITNPNDATRLGIGMVHQHFKLVHNFTVAENIVLGQEDAKRGLIHLDEAKARIVDLSKQYGLRVDPDSLIHDISVGMQQRVEILKMLYRESDILIFDEPTAVLTPQEIEELIEVMRGLTKEGKTILLITHKLHEIKAIADRVTVLRKGQQVGVMDVASTSIAQMAEAMVGRPVLFRIEKSPAKPGDVVLDVKGLSVHSDVYKKDVVKDMSFSVRRGEILCIAGVEGNGQTQLIEAITGLKECSGTISLLGDDISSLSIRQRNLKGVSHIPEDRHKHGLVLDYSLANNLILQTYFQSPMRKGLTLQFEAIKDFSKQLIEKFDIRSGKGIGASTRSMSGGNQQKAIIAREVSRDTDLLIAVQPTRGLDVGAIEFVHQQLIAQRDLGKAVLLVSLELDEVMSISDRIIVMYEGQHMGEFDSTHVSEQELGIAMAGGAR
jgi:general nucleoside transport system ATP-binding protein